VQKHITELGPKEAEFLSLISTSKTLEFTNSTALNFWGTRELTKKKLHVLERKGWIARIERGKYLVIPLEAGPTRQWTEDSYLIAAALVQPAAISYWSAIRHWNWTEQIPRIVYVQTTSRKKTPRRKIFGVQYEFVTVPEGKFYGNLTEWRNGKKILITEKEKTLVDCADHVERAGTIEELAKAVKAAASEISWRKLDEYVEKFPNRAVKKRLGYLFETLVPVLSQEAVTVLESWQTDLSAGFVLLQPSNKKIGRIVTRWRIQVNAGVS